MNELTINPSFFVLPGLCFFVWMVSRNRFALNVSLMSLVAALVLTVMASNPVKVSDSVTKIWHECNTAVHAGSKTCHVQFGAAPVDNGAHP